MWTHFGLNGIAAKKDDWNVCYRLELLELDIDQNPRSGGSVVYSTSGCPSRPGFPQIVPNNSEPPSLNIRMAQSRKQSEISVASSATGMLQQPGTVEDEEDIEIV